MRKKSTGHSIENLFEGLAPIMAEQCDIRIVRVPCQGAALLEVARNLLFTARQQADVIHVTGDIYYCALAVRRHRCVLTIHDLASLRRLRGVRKRIVRLLWYALPLKWAPRLTVISAETKRQIVREFPKVAAKIQMVPNCVDEAFSHNQRSAPRDARRRPRVLQVGTGPNKNLDRVAAAASGLPLHLRIIGPLSASQRALLGSLDLDWSSATDVSKEQLLQEYQTSDALVFASTYEGFGLPIVEAQMSGLPVITSNIAPMTEVAGKGAFFVDPYDEGQIRKALGKLLFSPPASTRLIMEGTANSERFRPTVVASKYVTIYTRMLEAAKGETASAEVGWPTMH